MNYYHVIYTSSQRLLSGGNGFGIRTATEGTPQEYLKHVVNCVTANKFNSNVDTCDKMPTASELLANDGTAIRDVPPRYFYLQETVNGKPLYIIGRNVYLGFTEPFYFRTPDGAISGKSCRTGNFLLDLYLFEERPTRSAFQILYEHPEKGEGVFIPRDASPSKNNHEMANYATGDPVQLPVVDWPFKENKENLEKYDEIFLQTRDVADKQKAVELLFAFVEARLLEKKLVVKHDWVKTHQLVADVIKLLPDDLIGTFTFSTNYHGNGYSLPADVNFCNQYYKTQYMGKDFFMDLGGTPLQTMETVTYKQIVLDALSRGNLIMVRRLVGWMMSATYKDSRNLKPHTNKTLFVYTQQPEAFTLRMLHEENNEDAELLNALNKLIDENPKNQQPFVTLLRQTLDDALSSITPDELADLTARQVYMLEIYRKYIGITNDIISQYSEKIEDALISDPICAISHLGVNTVRAYTHNFAKGLNRQDLARYIVDMEKEQLPQTLADAINLVQKYETKHPNASVLQLLADNFRVFFNNVFDNVVHNALNGNKRGLATQLDLQLLVPMSEARNDAAYQQLEMLCEVLNDNVNIDAYNYRDILGLLQRVDMIQSKTGDAVKCQLFEEKSLAAIPAHVKCLYEVWHLDPLAIINQAERMLKENKMDSVCQKAFVKSALENSGFQLEQIIETLKKYKFSYNELDLFLSSSPNFRSAYKSYRRKQFFSSLFRKIASVFSRKPKTINNGVEKSENPQSDVRGKALSESDLDKVEKYLNNRNMPVSDRVKSNAEEVERRYFEAKRKGSIPEELKRFIPILKMWIAVLSFSFLLPVEVFATGQSGNFEAYGDFKNAPKCYVVSAKTLNVRTSPSLYKGNRKTKRKDNVGFKLSQGDTVFVNTLAQPTTADGISWIEFIHDGSSYYTDITKLCIIDNPRNKLKVDILEEYESGGFFGWLQGAAPWILLVFTIIVFIISFAVDTPDADSLKGEPRDDTGMRPMFMYSLRPYKFFAGLSLRMLIGLAGSIIIMLVLGLIVWGLLWVVKILMWILIVIGWICGFVGLYGLFKDRKLIPLLVVGGVIIHFQETLTNFGNKCVETGMAFFNTLNMWDFAYNLVQNYWIHAVIISLVPLGLFLFAAIVMIIVAWCLRGYEAWTTYRYNVKNPCPWCKEKSEPARYFDGETEDGELPTKLRPGIYGLLYITHPKTGTRMPTLIANGRDQLLRACPHCSYFINFTAGTEKHVAFVGLPESGKTTLLCSIIGELQRHNSNMHFTGIHDNIGKDFKDSVDYYINEFHLDEYHLPQKTQAVLKSSVECTLPRVNGGLPYHLYFDDVAGELFTASGNDQDMLLFAKTVENIIFIVDPMTTELDMDEVSSKMKKWLLQEDIVTERNNRELQDATMACDCINNVLIKNGRNLTEIDFTFALVKSDMGYLGDTRKDNPEALRRFIANEMALPHLISKTKSFRSVSYVAVSVYEKDNKGILTLCNNLQQQLQLNINDTND